MHDHDPRADAPGCTGRLEAAEDPICGFFMRFYRSLGEPRPNPSHLIYKYFTSIRVCLEPWADIQTDAPVFVHIHLLGFYRSQDPKIPKISNIVIHPLDIDNCTLQVMGSHLVQFLLNSSFSLRRYGQSNGDVRVFCLQNCLAPTTEKDSKRKGC